MLVTKESMRIWHQQLMRDDETIEVVHIHDAYQVRRKIITIIKQK